MNQLRNIKLTISYRAARYTAFSKPNKSKTASRTCDHASNTILGKLSEIIRRFLAEEIELFAAIRTEPGVHALCQTVHFKTASSLSTTEIMEGVNRYLPKDISILHIAEMPPSFHSALHLKKVSYLYRLQTGPAYDVFSRTCTDYLKETPDLSAMRDMACAFLGTHDFRAFTTLKTKKSTERTILDIQIREAALHNIPEIQIEICASGFLYNMAPSMIARLLAAGYHALQKQDAFHPEAFARLSPEEQKRFHYTSGLLLSDTSYETNS